MSENRTLTEFRGRYLATDGIESVELGEYEGSHAIVAHVDEVFEAVEAGRVLASSRFGMRCWTPEELRSSLEYAGFAETEVGLAGRERPGEAPTKDRVVGIAIHNQGKEA